MLPTYYSNKRWHRYFAENKLLDKIHNSVSEICGGRQGAFMKSQYDPMGQDDIVLLISEMPGGFERLLRRY